MGKSSLISTFVSRYFAEDGDVPGLMTRVQLPPTTTTHHYFSYPYRSHQQQQHKTPTRRNNATATTSTTTTMMTTTKTTVTTAIVDSQRGDVAFMPRSVRTTTTSGAGAPPVAVPPPPKQVDSILLVSDLSRPETLTRLEQHWLPLLEEAYHGKVRERERQLADEEKEKETPKQARLSLCANRNCTFCVDGSLVDSVFVVCVGHGRGCLHVCLRAEPSKNGRYRRLGTCVVDTVARNLFVCDDLTTVGFHSCCFVFVTVGFFNFVLFFLACFLRGKGPCHCGRE